MFRQDCSHHLLTTILPFWENLTDWERGGWFGYVNHDLSVERGAHKGCILNSRILWTFSTAARVTGDKSLLRYARHAFAFLPHFEDTERGGVYWSVTAAGQDEAHLLSGIRDLRLGGVHARHRRKRPGLRPCARQGDGAFPPD